MAVIRLQDGESGNVRPGDAVFDYNPKKRKFPIHVGVFSGEKQRAVGPTWRMVRVQGVPGNDGGWILGDSAWGMPGNYEADFVGQRLDVKPENVKEVALISFCVMTAHNKLRSKCEWKPRLSVDANKPILDGIPLFLAGTCGQYVEYLYECAGLDLIDQNVTYNPRDKKRLNPATQLCVFWEGSYLLRARWNRKYKAYPACISGPRNKV